MTRRPEPKSKPASSRRVHGQCMRRTAPSLRNSSTHVPLLDRPTLDVFSRVRHCFGRASSAESDIGVCRCPAEAAGTILVTSWRSWMNRPARRAVQRIDAGGGTARPAFIVAADGPAVPRDDRHCARGCEAQAAGSVAASGSRSRCAAGRRCRSGRQRSSGGRMIRYAPPGGGIAAMPCSRPTTAKAPAAKSPRRCRRSSRCGIPRRTRRPKCTTSSRRSCFRRTGRAKSCCIRTRTRSINCSVTSLAGTFLEWARAPSGWTTSGSRSPSAAKAQSPSSRRWSWKREWRC